eukprot:1991873-Pyramimonas_sp.AAC.1
MSSVSLHPARPYMRVRTRDAASHHTMVGYAMWRDGLAQSEMFHVMLAGVDHKQCVPSHVWRGGANYCVQ